MYTQCPDCDIAFRVTAKVLKQAAGQVRCGGCGNSFNALSYLSEKMPKQPVAKETNTVVPELRPEIIKTDSGPPHSISAEQSAALLKTLDELAGSDVRIEDTGVEWRVLDEEEATAPAADDDDADLGANDEYQDDAESPLDALRFDDNTPLPEDFVPDDSSSDPAASEPAFDDEEDDDDPETPDDEVQPDTALSEPDEWQDILGEFMDLAEEVAAPIEGIDSEVDTEDVSDESISGDPLDTDSQFALQAEAMGIDLSGINELENDEDDLTESLEDEDAAEYDNDIEQLDLIEEQTGLMDKPVVESHAIEDELAADEAAASDEHYVPPMTEEEHTVNMQIDQDLMALAIEDEDGFASTIIVPEKDTEKKAREEAGGDEENDGYFEVAASTPGFETIIMEGESIRSAMGSEKLAADRAAAAELVELARADEAEQSEKTGGPRYGMIAAVVLLMLTLAGQMIHQSREALATIPVFNDTVGLLYRAIGQPVQPAWDITGWRFEATKGSTEGEDDDLTVYSRLGNNSDGPLPYPLIGISLTDRFEESIGSRVLDPAEYLQNDLDPRKLVEPGNTFNAVITIKSASEDATGFKLNVCYRSSDGQLRCAIDDFK
jgi:predicted Zn finger-like uncharacterized protein